MPFGDFEQTTRRMLWIAIGVGIFQAALCGVVVWLIYRVVVALIAKLS